jgi:leucyl aminopeptidase (aminopeptidase T)
MSDESPSTGTAAKLAQSILRKNLQVKPGERITVEAWPHTLPWAVALAREARRLKATPVILYEDEASYWDSVDHGEAKVVGAAAAHEWAALSKTDVYIHMWGPGDRVRLNALPPKQLGAVFGFNNGWYTAARKAGTRGARLEIGRPFPTLAQTYGVDQETWTNQVVAATLVDPSELAKRAAPVVKMLQSGKRLHITHSNGTDLTLGLAKRRVNSYTGRPVTNDATRPFDLLCNLPSGAVRVSLDELVADGTIVGNRTCYYDDGVATEPVFEFSGGKLTHSEFGSGGERFDKAYQKGGVGRDRPGFLAIGLNPELHNTPQVEDIEAGAVMVSVGGNRNLGGKNRSPFFGWAVVGGAQAEIDGKTVPLSG